MFHRCRALLIHSDSLMLSLTLSALAKNSRASYCADSLLVSSPNPFTCRSIAMHCFIHSVCDILPIIRHHVHATIFRHSMCTSVCLTTHAIS